MDLTGGESPKIRIQLELVVKALNRLCLAGERIAKVLEFSLAPQGTQGSFRTSQNEGQAADASWLGQTNEVRMAVEEFMAKQYGRGLSKEEEAELEHRFQATPAGGDDSDVLQWGRGLLTDSRPRDSEEESGAPQEGRREVESSEIPGANISPF